MAMACAGRFFRLYQSTARRDSPVREIEIRDSRIPYSPRGARELELMAEKRAAKERLAARLRERRQKKETALLVALDAKEAAETPSLEEAMSEYQNAVSGRTTEAERESAATCFSSGSGFGASLQSGLGRRGSRGGQDGAAAWAMAVAPHDRDDAPAGVLERAALAAHIARLRLWAPQPPLLTARRAQPPPDAMVRQWQHTARAAHRNPIRQRSQAAASA